MPTGSAVVRYDGKRGIVWRIKYRDAKGKQVMETLGKASDGWTERKATQELRARENDVRRIGLTRPSSETFAAYVAAGETENGQTKEAWVDEHCDAHGLKPSTRYGYRLILDVHLVPVFGSMKLDSIDVESIEAYVARKRRAGLAARTINRHLNVLSLIFAKVVRVGRMARNPVPHVTRPPDPRKVWRILQPGEIARVERAFLELIAETEHDSEERAWREQARVIFLLVTDTGMRRGEVLGLRWRAVRLADPEGPRVRVSETFTLGQVGTPKSKASERTIELTDVVADELAKHLGLTAYSGDEERVFCSPTKGTPFDPVRYAKTLRLALARAEIGGRVRPFHDGRHTSITNGAAAGMFPAALQKRAGHSSYSTTELYIDLAGVAFPEEAAKLGQRLWGNSLRDVPPSRLTRP